jgi:hypothetical protein
MSTSEGLVIRHATKSNPRRPVGRATVLAVITLGLASLPAAVQAAPLPGASKVSSATATCDKVSASSVSSVVGHKVPDPKGLTVTSIFDAKLNVSATATLCSYGVVGASMSSLKKVVLLDYETLSSAIPLAEIEKDENSTTTKLGRDVKFHSYGGLGVTGVEVSYLSGATPVTTVVGISGTKLAAASLYGTKDVSEVAALAKLAVKAYT